MGSQHITDTLAMLGAFGSVGTTGYTLTRTDIERQPWQKKGSVRYAHADFVTAAPELIDAASQDTPHNGLGVTLVQLDDLKPDMLRRVAPFAFLCAVQAPTLRSADGQLALRHDLSTTPARVSQGKKRRA